MLLWPVSAHSHQNCFTQSGGPFSRPKNGSAESISKQRHDNSNFSAAERGRAAKTLCFRKIKMLRQGVCFRKIGNLSQADKQRANSMVKIRQNCELH
jgi:hypothetical protein